MQQDTDYKNLLTEVIKKQIVILGPDITLAKARNVKGLKVEDDGTVSEISGPPQKLIQELINQFVALSGLIVEKTMEPLFASFPQAPGSEKILDSVSTQAQDFPQEPKSSDNTIEIKPEINASK